MAVRIRMTRAGTRNSPFYRIVVADIRAPRDGRFIEMVGTYDPRTDPPQVSMKHERLQHWIKKGAVPSRTVSQLMLRAKRAAQTEAAEA